MDISVIVVNYNTADCIAACIQSILRQTGVSLEVIVVDNASADQSIQILESFTNRIQLIRSDVNTGFAKANNIAFRKATGDYIFLFNPDAELSRDDDIFLLKQWMQEHPRVGLAAPRVVKGGRESLPNDRYPGESQKSTEASFAKLPGSIAWVIGAAMIIPRSIYEAVHGFDEDFFLYAEDADLCLRIRQLGYEIGYIPTVAVLHIGAASEGATSWYDRAIKKIKAKQKFCQKHYDPVSVSNIMRKEVRQAKRKWLQSRLRLWISLSLWKNPKDQKYRAILDMARSNTTGHDR